MAATAKKSKKSSKAKGSRAKKGGKRAAAKKASAPAKRAAPAGGKSKFVTIGDVTLEVERRGTGKPLLLLYTEKALELDAPLLRDSGKRDYPSMTERQLEIVARNSESFARFCWEPYMPNPKLKHRLHRIQVPTLLVWGKNDGIVTTDYGAAYKKLIPGAKLVSIAKAG